MASSAFSFSDGQGVTWNCRVTWAAIRRSAAAGVDLSKTEEHLADFHRCSPALVDAVWAVCGPDAKALDIDRDNFENRLSGEVLEAARVALIAGVEDFFPPGRARLIRAAENEVATQMRALLDQLPKSSTESQAKSA